MEIMIGFIVTFIFVVMIIGGSRAEATKEESDKWWDGMQRMQDMRNEAEEKYQKNIAEAKTPEEKMRVNEEYDYQNRIIDGTIEIAFKKDGQN